VKDPINDIDRPQDKPVRYLTPHPSTWKNYACCPWAKTVIAIDPETDNLVVCPVTCKRWGCEYCAVRKIRKLAFLTNAASPNRWIRLGVDPARYTDQQPTEENKWTFKSKERLAWEHTSPMLPEVMRVLRKIRAIECEYLRVTELHQSGMPHYHALLRSGFIPQKQLSSEWAKLTGAPVVWIAKIDSTFSSFRYLVKYLTKLHKIEWTDRHVSYSRGFFPEEAREKMAFPERAILERNDEHPWLWLSRRYPHDEIGADDNGCYHLKEEYCGTPYDLDRADVGLPPLPSKEPPPPAPKVQSTLALAGDTSEWKRGRDSYYAKEF
jgi:hypothetical protein